MNPIQTAIANLFRIPTMKPKQRNYAGAKRDGVSMSGWATSGSSADSVLSGALSTLRQRSWDLYRNDPNVTGAVNDIVSETIGNGILLQSKVTKKRGTGLDLKLNTAIEDAFNRWADNPKWCDAAGKMTFWKMQKTILLSVLVSGEVLVRFVRKKFDDSPLPFALEIIEADQLDENFTNGRVGVSNRIRMGVEIDEWRRPVAYWVLPDHPGDYFQTGSYSPQRIPASEILHIWNWRGFRPGQTRGVPALHSVIVQSRNLLGYQESEVVKARIQSCIGAFIESEQSDELALPQDEDGFFYRNFEPGMLEDLPPGKKIVPFNPSSPNPNLPEFVRTMQRAIARGLNTSSYLVSGDLADANYSSMRVGLLQQRKQFEILRDDLNEDFNHKIYREFLKQATFAGYLAMPGDYEYNPDFYLKDSWVGDAWPWVDPSKDVAAKKMELEMGTTTITQILKEKGVDIEDHYAIKAQEKELRKQYGIEEPTPDGQPPQETPSDEPAPLVEGMQSVTPARSLDELPTQTAVIPEVLPPAMPCCKECEEEKEDDDMEEEKEKEDQNITINISINGNQITASQESDEEEDDMEEEDDEPAETAIGDYTLLPGFSPVRELFGERKIKAKKKKNCSNGQVCGFSCISKTKTCIANMTTAQLMAHNEAKRQARREKVAAKKAAAGGAAIVPSSEVKTYQEAIERGKAIADPYIKQIESDLEYVTKTNQRMLEIQKKTSQLRIDQRLAFRGDNEEEYMRISKELKSLYDEQGTLFASVEPKVTKIEGVMGQLRDSQMKLSESDAQSVTRPDFDKSLKKTRRKDGKTYRHDIDEINANMTEFYRLTNGKGTFEKLVLTDNRAYAESPTMGGANLKTINIGTPARTKSDLKRVLFHEMAHHLEDQDPNITKIVTDWRNSRATGSPKALPNTRGKEIAYPDKFIDPYVGRTYERSGMVATEVLSMGLEKFSTPARMGLLYNGDKDHFYLTLGILGSL